jgi:transcriptional regulator with XRE-family HTH domain
MMGAMTADDLGARIRAARRRKRWSQQRLADEIKVSPRTVGAWERGETFPRYAEGDIDLLERALGVSLTGGDPPEEDPDEQQLWALNLPPATIRRLVAAYRGEAMRRTA